MTLLRSRLRVLLLRTATWVLLGALLVILVMVFSSVGLVAGRGGGGPGASAGQVLVRFPGAFDQIFSFLLGLGGLFAVVYGAAVAGSEWSWGTLKLVASRGQRLASYLTLSFVALAILIGCGLLIAYGASLLAAFAGASLGGIPTDGITDPEALASLPLKLVRAWIAITSVGAVGFAIATIARSQLAGIGFGIALYFGGTFLTIFLADVVKWLPFNAAAAVITPESGHAIGRGFEVPYLEPNVALLAAAAWLVALVVSAAVYVERAEIRG